MNEEALSLEELIDLAHAQLDAIERGTVFADTTTWMSVYDFVSRCVGMDEQNKPLSTYRPDRSVGVMVDTYRDRLDIIVQGYIATYPGVDDRESEVAWARARVSRIEGLTPKEAMFLSKMTRVRIRLEVRR
jgi:hypothetical protein